MTCDHWPVPMLDTNRTAILLPAVCSRCAQYLTVWVRRVNDSLTIIEALLSPGTIVASAPQRGSIHFGRIEGVQWTTRKEPRYSVVWDDGSDDWGLAFGRDIFLPNFDPVVATELWLLG